MKNKFLEKLILVVAGAGVLGLVLGLCLILGSSKKETISTEQIAVSTIATDTQEQTLNTTEVTTESTTEVLTTESTMEVTEEVKDNPDGDYAKLTDVAVDDTEEYTDYSFDDDYEEYYVYEDSYIAQNNYGQYLYAAPEIIDNKSFSIEFYQIDANDEVIYDSIEKLTFHYSNGDWCSLDSKVIILFLEDARFEIIDTNGGIDYSAIYMIENSPF